MRKIIVAVFGCALAGVLSACGSNEALQKPHMSKDEAVQAELAAQRGGPLVYQKFLLTQDAWKCTQQCPEAMTLSFNNRALGGDIGATATMGGRAYSSAVSLWPDYQFDIQGGLSGRCRFIINWMLDCNLGGENRHVVFERPRSSR